MFHFNGLETTTRAAKLTEFRVLLRFVLYSSFPSSQSIYLFRSADDAVGQTIAFAGGEAGGSIGGGICPIEEVFTEVC